MLKLSACSSLLIASQCGRLDVDVMGRSGCPMTMVMRDEDHIPIEALCIAACVLARNCRVC